MAALKSNDLSPFHANSIKEKTGGHSVTETLGDPELKHSYADVARALSSRAGSPGPCAPNDIAPEVPGPIPSLYLLRGNANGAECGVYFFVDVSRWKEL